MLQYEEKARLAGYATICGVDEAGAGPLAGPVVAAAVVLQPGDRELEELGLTDSKKLTEKKRDLLFDVIQEKALAFHIAEISPVEIDNSDILSARLKAMSLAIAGLPCGAEYALVDGNRDKGKSWEIQEPHELIIKGDSLSLSIAAASVLAKVHRDRLMLELDAVYPQYGFAKHKGYGTKFHLEQVKKHKLCPVHRRTFFRKKWEELGLG